MPRKGWTRLTTKIGPREYYKGKGVKAPGHHTSKGGAPSLQVMSARHITVMLLLLFVLKLRLVLHSCFWQYVIMIVIASKGKE